MVVVSIVGSTAVVIVVVKVLVRDAAVINMVVVVEILPNDVWVDVVIDTSTGVEIIVVGAVVSALKFAVTISYCVDVLFAVVSNELTDVLACVIMGFVTDIVVGVLAGANISDFE